MYSVQDGWLSQRGLPHSDISGSQPVSGSPKLFAAVHVLLRLSLPRHPPCALRSLTVPQRHVSSTHTSSPLPGVARARFACSARFHELYIALLRLRTQSTRPGFPGTRRSPRSASARVNMLRSLDFQGPVDQEDFRVVILCAARLARPWATARVAPGGAERDRTDDLRLAKPALSQLSYSPETFVGRARRVPTHRQGLWSSVRGRDPTRVGTSGPGQS